MRESIYTSKLLSALRAHAALKDFEVIKHCNPYHRGVPDFSISAGTFTLWGEVKRHKEKPTKIQQHYIDRLDAVVLWYEPASGKAFFLHRGALSDWLDRDELVRELVGMCV